VEADYRDGILEITVPISTSGSTARSIPVSRSQQSQSSTTSESVADVGFAAGSESGKEPPRESVG
jgi:hypothetical protein